MFIDTTMSPQASTELLKGHDRAERQRCQRGLAEAVGGLLDAFVGMMNTGQAWGLKHAVPQRHRP